MGAGPVDTVQCGKVKIDVWENPSRDGKYVVQSFAVSKNYKASDGSWKTTNSYTLAELTDIQIAIMQIQLKYRVKGNQVEADQPAY